MSALCTFQIRGVCQIEILRRMARRSVVMHNAEPAHRVQLRSRSPSAASGVDVAFASTCESTQQEENMKRNVWIGGLAAIVLAYGGIGIAQTTGGTADQKSSGGTVTVSGCLARADEAGGATGTTGTTAATPPSSSASSASDHYVLKNAKSGSSSPSSSTTTSTPSPAGTSGSTYMLEGKTSDLKSHVGEQVEISGKIMNDSSSRSSSPTSAAGGTSSS